MLVTMTARLVRSHGEDETPLPGSGLIEYRPAAHGTFQGALRGADTVYATITEGVAEPVELTPGPWRVVVRPDHGAAWESWLIELTEDMPEPVDLVDLAPVLVVDGEKWTAGPPGASVVGGRDNGDGTVSFELSDGTYTDPVVVPPGPAGRGIVSISDPDADSRVTIVFTDGTETTVQAIRGADGHTPAITWEGTSIVVDGEQGPDLKGEPGADSTVPGPANSLTIGSVTTGATGTPASATITGTAPEQTLNLTLPRGEQGIPGTAELPTTGWRDVTSLITDQGAVTSGSWWIIRDGPHVTLSIVNFSCTAAVFFAEPSGFVTPRQGRPGTGGFIPAGAGNAASTQGIYINRFSGNRLATLGAVSGIFLTHTWRTNDPWPTILPGTPTP